MRFPGWKSRPESHVQLAAELFFAAPRASAVLCMQVSCYREGVVFLLLSETENKPGVPALLHSIFLVLSMHPFTFTDLYIDYN